MRVLMIGGTGLISTGVVKHLLARGADVTVFNRGKTEDKLQPRVRRMQGDRNVAHDLEKNFKNERFDAVIDMICYTPVQAEGAVRAFGGRCEQFIFCSTVCTYGVKVPPGVLVDETFPLEPISTYGRDKVACEQIFRKAHDGGLMKVTIVRPSHTYGPGYPLADNLEFNGVCWDRIERGRPVLCSADGLGLWVATHRDDCGKFFAYAALNPKTYGEAYNTTRDQNTTWREYYRQAAAALGKEAQLVFMPSNWIVEQNPERFSLLRDITAFHGAYSSSKAKRDVPEFRCEIDLKEGAAETFADVRRRNAWRNSDEDPLYEDMLKRALAAGVKPLPA